VCGRIGLEQRECSLLPTSGEPDEGRNERREAAGGCRRPFFVSEGGGSRDVGSGCVQRPRVDGILRVKSNDELTLVLENKGTRPVYVTLLAFDDVADPERDVPPGTLTRIYPDPGEEPRAIAPGQEVRLPRFQATAILPLERTIVKLIATSVRIDFEPLLVPPDVGSRALKSRLTRGRTRGADAPLFSLMKGVMHGGPRAEATRGISARASSEAGDEAAYWATGLVIFDVEQ